MSRQPGEQPDEMIDAYIRRLLQGQGAPDLAPDLARAGERERAELERTFTLLDAIAGIDADLVPPLEDDPVARVHQCIDRGVETKSSAYNADARAPQTVSNQKLRVVGVGFSPAFGGGAVFIVNAGERAKQNGRIAHGAANRTGGVLAV